MQFAIRSSTNTLATADNLKRLKKTTNDNCKMCLKPNTRPKKATLFHILNHFDAFLGDEERFQWRHDSVLYHYHYITLAVKEDQPENIKIYADLEGHKINGKTIPQNIVVSASLPDLVVIDNSTSPPTVTSLN